MAAVAVFGGLLSIAILTPPDVARAFAIHECTDDQFTRWEGQYATYDRANGGFADWWQDEIDEAAHIWDDDGGANFSFRPSSYSSHDWYKQLRIYDHRPGLTLTEWTALDDCRWWMLIRSSIPATRSRYATIARITNGT